MRKYSSAIAVMLQMISLLAVVKKKPYLKTLKIKTNFRLKELLTSMLLNINMYEDTSSLLSLHHTFVLLISF